VARPALIFMFAAVLAGFSHIAKAQGPAGAQAGQTRRSRVQDLEQERGRNAIWMLLQALPQQHETHLFPRAYPRHVLTQRRRFAADRSTRDRQPARNLLHAAQTHVVRTAKIHVYYAFSPSLLPQLTISSC